MHTFLVELTRTLEKISIGLLKEMPNCLQKLKKKFIEFFGAKSFDYIKGVNSSIDMSMRIY